MNRRVAKQERSEQTRTDILQTALDLFSTRGFAAVSLRDIAERVGVNHAMIRYHFGSKEELWRDSAAYLFERLAEEIPAPDLASEADPVAALKRYIKDYVHYCARHPEHARLMVQESIVASDRLQWVSENYIRPNHARTLKLIEGASLPAGLTGMDPVMLLYMVVAIAQMPYLVTAELQFSHERDVLANEAIEAHADAVVKFIFRD
ncbi:MULTISPECIES: TetR/AcrR family transcriptional regulator [Pseudomonas aeruginosa group]|uniref:TetR/AcrR family transcriptional regulator n=1 Tax=Pseudomonas aeruginosa group TaxID=136841 RepID=UPI00053EDC8D|nr:MULTISPECIES: TetR/AcrR family transcriptional regulator [Pseudomonas aeruginosa group]AVR67666.1 TetR/AcrR family transcriptional regulator [Pseudomonas paraeruginosa]KAB0742047.1 TetR/AcrR family transcriptional regulator [Pseudomonas aeruginosa]KSP85667.1 TetR family transcriptional regulator [Pseudomonas aeruginosa]MBG3903573.1 TetR/AcrR family transcriptional regulator [Pseudomonas aeruginosa]MBG4069888.1 TetR/AcrR family transcriptional regulator [Pseudomonas aeruginosa]